VYYLDEALEGSWVTQSKNLDPETVAGFGQEWAAYDQTTLSEQEHQMLFERYFSIFPFDEIPTNAEGFDLGCGSGRWAALVADRVRTLHCIDPSSEALEVAKRRLEGHPSVAFHLASVDSMPLPDESQDFGYSLGVLHHVPDTSAAIRDCVRKLKPGAPFLLYLYYRFDNRPAWFRTIWKVSDLGRQAISRLPFGPRNAVSTLAAVMLYWPLARAARLAEKLGANPERWPLSAYRELSFYSMRTDALDRLGTRLEQRFTRVEIEAMMSEGGLRDIRFSEEVPYWVACGRKHG
jgi:ubiquinone/menaquinone biosynthesis C-methylase UbiE